MFWWHHELSWKYRITTAKNKMHDLAHRLSMMMRCLIQYRIPYWHIFRYSVSWDNKSWLVLHFSVHATTKQTINLASNYYFLCHWNNCFNGTTTAFLVSKIICLKIEIYYCRYRKKGLHCFYLAVHCLRNPIRILWIKKKIF
jgi:hypothetical protein